MSVPTNIRIKIVLLMAKFESPIVEKQKVQVEFGNNTSSEVCIAATFQHFCEIGTMEERSRTFWKTVENHRSKSQRSS